MKNDTLKGQYRINEQIRLDAWLDIIQENAKHTSTTKRLKDELHSLYNRLEKLSTIHPQTEVRDMYTLLMGRIK